MKKSYRILFYLSLLILITGLGVGCQNKTEPQKKIAAVKTTAVSKPDGTIIDTIDYDNRIAALHVNDSLGRWKNKTPYPLPGAVLPFKRVVAFYGNLFSKRMGILGQLPKQQMLDQLREETEQWSIADPTIPVVPALHYVAVTAQGKPGKQNKYRQRMPFRQIDTIVSWAKSINGIVFLDVQIGQSTIKEEVAALEKYLKLPTVHLGIDPEFAMKIGEVPGRKIGTLSASDINDAVDILAKIVKDNKLSPKILVVHRFTRGMVTDYEKIKTCPEVQIVMHMDGWGGKALKRSTYQMAIYKEPVQFTGFKLFYKHDNKGNHSMFTPQEILKFTPKPVYIQYQ